MTLVINTVQKSMSAFDQNRADAVWERTQEQALRIFQTRGIGRARPIWTKATQIAKSQFEWGDPRIAASCANQAFSMIRQKDMHQGQLLFDESLRCWKDSWRWVSLMEPPHLGGQFEKSQFTGKARQSFYALIQRGQAMTEALARNQLATGGFEDWQEHKPKTMCDVRRLVAAIFLIASLKP